MWILTDRGVEQIADKRKIKTLLESPEEINIFCVMDT